MKKEQLDLIKGNAGFRACYDILDDEGLESISVYQRNDDGDYDYVGSSTTVESIDCIEEMDDHEIYDWLDDEFGMTYIED